MWFPCSGGWTDKHFTEVGHVPTTMVAKFYKARYLQLLCIGRGMHRAFGFYFEVKQRRARLVLGLVTVWVQDCEACPTHWTSCQVGQVVSLLGLGTVVATLSCWPPPSGMLIGLMVPTWQRGFYLGTPVSSISSIKNHNNTKIIMSIWYRTKLV